MSVCSMRCLCDWSAFEVRGTIQRPPGMNSKLRGSWRWRNSPPSGNCPLATPPPPPGGSVGTTDQGNGKGRGGERPMGNKAYGGKGQGKGKGRGEGRLGQGGRGRSQGGERRMGTTTYGEKRSKGRAANGDRPVGAAGCRREQHAMASWQPPPALSPHWPPTPCVHHAALYSGPYATVCRSPGGS